eukprot:4982370-Pleurochrysis_carterae.AAC.5
MSSSSSSSSHTRQALQQPSPPPLPPPPTPTPTPRAVVTALCELSSATAISAEAARRPRRERPLTLQHARSTQHASAHATNICAELAPSPAHLHNHKRAEIRQSCVSRLSLSSFFRANTHTHTHTHTHK